MAVSDSGEVRLTDETTGGQKGQKLERFDLLPAGPLRQVARHYGVGARKYADRNWELGYNWSLSFGAMQRHLWAFWDGEDFDNHEPDCEPDCVNHTESHHLAAAAFHMFALLEFHDTHPEKDDRPTTVNAPKPRDPREFFARA